MFTNTIVNMGQYRLKEYIKFRERQVFKKEEVICQREISELYARVDTLRRAQEIDHPTYNLLKSMISALEKWNKENLVD